MMEKYMIEQIGTDCSGCSACANVCPNNCIHMEPDEEGFFYPVISKADCVKCRRCDYVCPIVNTALAPSDGFKKAWGAYNVDSDTLRCSSSGGVFSALAEEIIEEGGCVFGAAFRPGFQTLHHIKVDNIKELKCLIGSKYLQSEMEDCFVSVKNELANDRIVLFTGTPCQVAGLRSYLKKEYKNLLCAEVICHGTPSALLWQTYLKQWDVLPKSVSFRNKNHGWKNYYLSIGFSNGKEYNKNRKDDAFMQMFLSNYCLRESCYHCVVKSEKSSGADMTLGDFWGIEKIIPSENFRNGVSLVIVNTPKGEDYFKRIKGEQIEAFEVDYTQAVNRNSALNQSALRPSERNDFFHDLKVLNWKQMRKKYNQTKFTRIMKIIYSRVNKLKKIY